MDVGKTTVLQQVVAACGSDVLYVPVGSDGDVSASLYSALKIDGLCKGTWANIRSFLNLPSTNCLDASQDRFVYALKVLQEVAHEIYLEDGYPPSVVFDNAGQILKHPDGTKMVHLLQDTAKDISDKRYLIFMFASSESAVPNIMRSRSAASRLAPRKEIADITDKEAIDYLTCMCPNTTKDNITKAVALVGGRFCDLVMAAGVFNEGLETELETILLDTQRYKLMSFFNTAPSKIVAIIVDVARSILQSPSNEITRDEYNSFVSMLDSKDKQFIEETNSFWIKSVEVTFHSRLAQHYFKSLLSNSTTGDRSIGSHVQKYYQL